jgi:hypothetical protein
MGLKVILTLRQAVQSHLDRDENYESRLVGQEKTDDKLFLKGSSEGSFWILESPSFKHPVKKNGDQAQAAYDDLSVMDDNFFFFLGGGGGGACSEVKFRFSPAIISDYQRTVI